MKTMKLNPNLYRNPKHEIFSQSVLSDLETGVANKEISDSERLEILNSIASAKIEEWARYAQDLESWFFKYRDNMNSMAAGMSRPNKPGYYRANND